MSDVSKMSNKSSVGNIPKIEEVLLEINRCITEICLDQLEKLTQAVYLIGSEKERRIFCDGAGRSRLQVEGFAMRLAQMGWNVHVVGEATAPALRAGDLLFICSGSGETKILVEHAVKAKKVGAVLMAVTTNETSTLGKMSDHCVQVKAAEKSQRTACSVQPMGSLFEQCSGILFDLMILMLMEKMGLSGEEMFRNHSNLE